MSTITAKDGTEIYYKDWAEGPVVTFSHGWPLKADAWDGQMLFLAQNGFRAVAHDRRGLGGGGWFALSPGGTQVAPNPATDAGAMAVGAGLRRATRATA